MKNIFVLSFIAAILASISSISYAAFPATTGQVKFQGNIIESTCTASSDPVKMGTYHTSDITKTKGTEVPGSKKDFNINLTNCPVTTVPLLMDVKFSGSNKDTYDNRLLALDTSGATGIGIGFYNEKDTLIDLSSTNLLKQNVTISKKDMEIPLKVAYVSNGKDVKAGVANATLDFVIHYK
ncbi:type 1 fimbrial protein [Xenorhabdus sp. Flor]|uniref:fimbrial protein n=1 Tax=Xenorhabdus cabanillasii TaxID=351673 RepID=UPI0019C9F857|nr:fimbrial protein [Xenorhabdus sp. Flor]MBD2813653.1 type 1 fimbrial protein [Xenorhabdus sp. Flor]